MSNDQESGGVQVWVNKAPDHERRWYNHHVWLYSVSFIEHSSNNEQAIVKAVWQTHADGMVHATNAHMSENDQKIEQPKINGNNIDALSDMYDVRWVPFCAFPFGSLNWNFC